MVRLPAALAPLLAALAALAPVATGAQAFSSISSLPAPGPVAAATPVEATPAAGAAEDGAAPAAALPFSSVSSLGPDGAPATRAGAGPSLPVADDAPGMRVAERIVIEKSRRRLLLLRGGDVIAEYPVRLGLNPYGHKQREGDFRTPEGTYHLSRRNPDSEFFLSVEVSYPNAEDRARARQAGVRPGGLIMIHGQPNVPRKPPEYYANNDWTDGCIAVSNADMTEIWQRTRLGMPIEIRP